MSSGELRAFPGSSRLLVHPAAGRAARHVRCLAGASDWRRDLVDRAGSWVVGLVGTRRIRSHATWPWPGIDCDDLTERLSGVLPGLRVLGAVTPRQAGRQRLSVLGRSAGTLVIIKIGVDGAESPDGSLDAEAAALRLLTLNPLPGIATPRLVAVGTIEATDIDFIATTALAIGKQRAAIDAPLRTFEADLALRLADLPRPSGTPADAVPVHGDLTPWNLRRTRRGLALFDWESTGWGPAGSDIATYRRTSDEVRPLWLRRRAPDQVGARP